ncbi:MAG: MBL fold metallo-hydrolase [Chitinispirillales bacterium]|jgi:glyoxylase-like metal-dependent hydrolase (beta-lactamase superfamily II)|nr:MBL fold metallo-hydrolase [Chitinispirillales bacterium]
MNYKKFATGPLETNTCVIPHDNGTCLIVDPSMGCDEVIGYLRENSLRPIAILLTHGHYDHIMGIPEILAEYGDTQVFIHESDKDKLLSPTRNGSIIIGANFTHTENIVLLEDGMTTIGEFEFRVLHVPGHTQGGCSFVFGDVCFCGDTIFAGNVGRCDLPGGSFEQLKTSIREKILTLPPQTTLCPGHGGRTTVDREARTNPYLV